MTEEEQVIQAGKDIEAALRNAACDGHYRWDWKWVAGYAHCKGFAEALNKVLALITQANKDKTRMDLKWWNEKGHLWNKVIAGKWDRATREKYVKDGQWLSMTTS